jgi:hypothetical protein
LGSYSELASDAYLLQQVGNKKSICIIARAPKEGHGEQKQQTEILEQNPAKISSEEVKKLKEKP